MTEMQNIMTKKSHRGLIIGIIAAVLVLALAIGVYYFNNWYKAKQLRDTLSDPSFRLVSGLTRLNRDASTALSKEQAGKILPLVKDMKNNKSDKKILQTKADAIKAILNDAQKKALDRRPAMGANGQYPNRRQSGQGGQGYGGYGGYRGGQGGQGYAGGQGGQGYGGYGGGQRSGGGSWNGQAGGFNRSGAAGGGLMNINIDQLYDRVIKILEDTAANGPAITNPSSGSNTSNGTTANGGA